MICPKCGNKVKDSAAFCGNCGTKLPQKDVTEKVTRVKEAVGKMHILEKLKINDIGLCLNKAKSRLSVKAIVAIVMVFIGIIAVCNLIKRNDKISDDVSNFEKNPQFDRLSYINNAVSIEEYLRYRNNGLCYIEGYVVDSVPEERLYTCRNDTGSSWIVIDDRGCTLNANALPGDMVTVYGRYNDIVELTFTDGSRNNQVPMIYADKLVNNSMIPEDKDEFIDQVIRCMNLSDIMYGNENEYYGDYNAKIAIGVHYYWAKELKHTRPSYWASLTKEQYFGGWWVGRVDGYGVVFEFESNENIAEPYQNGAITDEDIDFYEKTTDGNIPIYARGRITKMEIVSPSVVRFTFCIDSFEAYD